MTNYFRICSHDSGLSSPAVILMTILLCTSTNAAGQETQDQKPATESMAYDDSVLRELREVQENFPSLAKRLGLVHITGVHFPLFCMGGVDPVCHRAVQQNCIESGPGKPDYQHCLDLANRVCCQPPVVTQQ